MTQGYLSMNEAAKYADVCLWTISQWCHTGKVPFYKVGRRLVRIKISDLDDFLNKFRVEARP